MMSELRDVILLRMSYEDTRSKFSGMFDTSSLEILVVFYHEKDKVPVVFV